MAAAAAVTRAEEPRPPALTETEAEAEARGDSARLKLIWAATGVRLRTRMRVLTARRGRRPGDIAVLRWFPDWSAVTAARAAVSQLTAWEVRAALPGGTVAPQVSDCPVGEKLLLDQEKGFRNLGYSQFTGSPSPRHGAMLRERQE